jgi:O-antigen/teichoic acid export membrane protein/cellulose synthase/poly-beta-1,6-N-acetylglucosamine synthase-like glycosyltransferase
MMAGSTALWGLDAAVFLAAIAIVTGLWLGYPAVMWLLARLRHERAESRETGDWPTISVVISAFNEAAIIGERVRNVLALDYPADRLELIVVDDGSTDATAEIVDGFSDARVRLLRQERRQGKAAAINRAIDSSLGDVLLFSDASNQYDTGVAKAVARAFNGPQIGAVVGRKTVDTRRGVGGGEGVYWKYENWLIEQEAGCGSAAVGTGEILAVRREQVSKIPIGAMVNDDLYQVISVLGKRKRVVFARDAWSREIPAATVRDEWERRNRITVGRWRACALAKRALRRADPLTRAKVVLHNQMRPVSALWMAAGLLTGLGLISYDARLELPHWIGTLALLQLAFYGLAAVAWAVRLCGGRLGYLEAPYFFIAAQAASLSGWWRYLTGRQPATWKPARRAMAEPARTEASETRPRAAEPTITAGTIVNGLGWAYGSFIGGKLLVFVSIVVLARLLAPRDFGAVTLALTAVTVIEMLCTLGLASALIFEEKDPYEVANVCFWTTVFAASAAALLTYHFAYRYSRFFHEPRDVEMLRVLVFAIVLNALGNTHDTLLRRGLSFRKKIIPDLGMAGAKGFFSVAFALFGMGAWALIWGQMAAVTVNLVLLWMVVPWRPSLRWSRAAARRMFGYAKHIYLMEVSGTVLVNLPYFTIGRILGDSALGFYTLAFKIPEVVLTSTLNVITRVIFPAFSRLQSDLARMREALLQTVRYTCVVTLPMAIGLMILGHEIVIGVYGWRWAPSGRVLQVLALYAGVRCISHHFGDYYKASGRPDILSKVAIVWWLLLPAALFYGAKHGGIVGVAWAQVFTRTVLTILHFVILIRLLRVRLVELLHSFLPAAEGCATMGLVVAVLQLRLKLLPPREDVLACAAIGATVYFLTIKLLHGDVLSLARTTMTTARKGPGTVTGVAAETASRKA